MAKAKPKTERQTKKERMRDDLWPDAAEVVWDYRSNQGWLNVPRFMPAILRVIDSLSSGKPVSSTYFDLWCRTYNDGFVDAARVGEMSFFSGFDGERAQRTWKSRLKILEDLGLIRTKPGASGDMSYILVLDPAPILEKLRTDGKIQDRFWNAYQGRVAEVAGRVK